MEAKNAVRGFPSRIVSSALFLGLALATTAAAQTGMPGLAAAKPRGDGLPEAQLKPPPATPAEPEKIPAPTKMAPEAALPNVLPAPALEAGEEGLAISLPAALRLAHAQAWDIIIATQQLRVAAAQLEGAEVIWLPTMQMGADYQYHSGPIQQVDGTVIKQDHSNTYIGAAPVAIFALTDAIFAPLSARQEVRAQDANIQTATNDTLTNMALVYYDLLEAEADLASIMDVDQRAAKLVATAVGMAPGIIPEVEVARARAAKANFEQVVETARQRWRDASAEVARVTRLKPTVVLQPLEPAHMRVTLVPPTMRPDELIPIGVANRPELTFEQAEAEAARERLRQERWRVLLPTLVARGGGTTPPDAMGVGLYGAGQNGDLNNYNLRNDWDVGAYWELRNMGFGNRALIRQRRAEYDLARSQQYRFQDVVTKEVTQAWVDVRSADRRMEAVLRELKQAELSATQNLVGMSEVKRIAGGVYILIIRPQEVVASLQALQTAYFDYYGVIADYNRAQFRLYRAIGSPAQALAGHNGLCGPLLPPDAAVPAPKPMLPASDPVKLDVPGKGKGAG